MKSLLTHPNNFFHSLEEPYKGCLLFVQKFILEHDENIREKWSFNTPFYHYKGKSIGFISYHPKTKNIYISFTHGNKIKHKALVSEGRKKMKIFMIDSTEDIDVKSLREILSLTLKELNKVD